MTHPDQEHSMVLLRAWQAHHTAVERLMDSTQDSIGLDPNGPLFTTVWALFACYTDALGVELGDMGRWMEWYQYANDMGLRGFEAGYDSNTAPIKTLEDLYALIAESRKRGAME